jgi:hypothetical protein
VGWKARGSNLIPQISRFWSTIKTRPLEPAPQQKPGQPARLCGF